MIWNSFDFHSMSTLQVEQDLELSSSFKAGCWFVTTGHSFPGCVDKRDRISSCNQSHIPSVQRDSFRKRLRVFFLRAKPTSPESAEGETIPFRLRSDLEGL
jgi:hypothetical protein